MTVADFNLQELLTESKWRGLRIDLSEALMLMTPGTYWRADIYQNRETKSGREGTPKKIATIVSNDGESPADLLRTVAAIYEQGYVKITEAGR